MTEELDPTRIVVQSRAPDDDHSRKAKEAANTPEARRLKCHLAAAYQVIADQGLDDALAGHISVRVPEAPDHFWVANLGLLFTEITPEALALVNHRGEIVEGGQMINLAGFLIHAAIHQARSEVHAVVHTHPPNGCVFSALGRPLEMIDQNTCAFFDDVALYEEYTGVVVDPGQTDRLVSSLGTKRALILRNHGLITTAETVGQATIDMLDLERLCERNLKALAVHAERIVVEPAAAAQARAIQTQPLRYAVQWEAMLRDLRRRSALVASFIEEGAS